MAVITTLEFDDAVSAGITSRQPNGAHGGFRSRTHQPHLLNRGHQLAQQFRYFQFGLGGRAESQAIPRRRLYRFNHLGMSVPKNQWTPGAHIIDIGFVIRVPHMGAFSPPEKYRRTAHRLEGAYRRVNAARDIYLRAFK